MATISRAASTLNSCAPIGRVFCRGRALSWAALQPGSKIEARIAANITVSAPARAGQRCQASGRRAAAVFALAEGHIDLELKVEGMMCGGCTSRVEEVVGKMEGVTKISVNLETKLAHIEVKAASQIDAVNMLPSLVQAIKDLGFEAEPHFS